MFDQMRYLVGMLLVLAAAIGVTLAQVLPARMACGIAVLAALIWAGAMTKRINPYQTDADRILKPTEFVRVLMNYALLMGVIAAVALAPVSALLAGPAGVLVTVMVALRIMR